MTNKKAAAIIVLAAALGLTAAQAQAQTLYQQQMLDVQRQQADALRRQNQILEDQRTTEFYQCLAVKRRLAAIGDYDGANALVCN